VGFDMKFRTYLTLATAAFIAATSLTTTASAQEQPTRSHGIAAVVNDDIVTTRDLEQRVLLMFATTGVERSEETIQRVQVQALRNLVDEHIQMQEAEKFNQSIADEEVNRSVARLIGRNGLDPNEVAQRLASIGVSIETLRDQVRSEIAWQRIVNGLYGTRIRISDAQIDETFNRLSANASKPNFRVGEIYIEATPDIGGMDGAMKGAEAMIEQVQQGAPFALLAQQFSSSPTAAQGGDLGWVREGELREEIDAAILALEPGKLSPPIQVPGGVYVIALLEKQISEAETVYKLKQVNIKAETEDEISEARSKLIAQKDTLKSCDTLTADVNKVDDLNTADMGEIKSGDLSEALTEIISKTDVGALSDPIDTPNGPVAIMVCDRSVSGSNVPTRDEIENRLMDQQLAQASKRHLRDLRRKATIVVR